MGKKIQHPFTPIPIDKNQFYAINKDFNIIHLYITERVRSFQNTGSPCYISNEQFSKELNFSVSTIRRAIKLLIDNKILYVSYGNNGKRRTLYIYDKEIAKSKQQEDDDEEL